MNTHDKKQTTVTPDSPSHSTNTPTPIDPSIPQREAANPESSVWVSASAGSGKTKVLTERVIRLLLPRQSGEAGTHPEKILCITFTKAAAAEMSLRINETLGKWSIIPEDQLIEKLTDLLGEPPSSQQIIEARKLFARVVDTPGGLKIMTIHAFCQSILSRFPLEAGLPPHFEVLDEHDAADLIKRARNIYFKKAKSSGDENLTAAMTTLAAHKNEQQFADILSDLLKERRQLRTLLDHNESHDTLRSNYRALFNIPETIRSEQDIIIYACTDENFDKTGLYEAVRSLSISGKNDQSRAIKIQLWLETTSENRASELDSYKSIHLTLKDEPKKIGKKALEDNPYIETILEKECERLLTINDQKNSWINFTLSHTLLRIGENILTEYEALKKQHAVLDFDDMILTTLDLLAGKTQSSMQENPAAWVLFKLDQGLDHILLDEAQDTNPEQWEIIRILADEFFHGYSSRDQVDRTIFVVGDEKQSIYSFQRANPETFHRMRKYFEARIKEAGRNWQNIQMNTSFRSTKAVLATVDETFNKPELLKGLGLPDGEQLLHNSFFHKRGGRVEIWPLTEASDKQETQNWEPPVKIVENTPPEALLAEKIASTIAGWIKNKKQLETKNRAIEPQDIMILVKSRTALVGQLIRALKKHDVPVSGADRLTLSEDLAIQDLLAAAKFALLPDDDLTLACLLKSPIIGYTENDLMDLALGRGKNTLWKTLKDSSATTPNLILYLQNLINEAGKTQPFEFFDRLLSKPGHDKTHNNIYLSMVARLGSDIQDPIEAFLNLCLNYENDHTPTLQNFITWHEKDLRQIKREMEKASSAVRLMTVHGSKGLQAPIVFLPDLLPSSTNNKDTRLLWPDKTDLPLPIWSPKSKNDSDLFKRSSEIIKQKSYHEYLRLLYVAMTRAEDQLFVTGYKNKMRKLEGSWKSLIDDSVNRLETRHDSQNINVFTESPPDSATDESRAPLDTTQNTTLTVNQIITSPHLIDKIEENYNEPNNMGHKKLPDWLEKDAPKEAEPPRTFTPSKSDDTSHVMASPLQTKQKNLYFLRGNITHKLLQLLPDLPNDSWEQICTDYVSKSGHDLSKKVRDEIISETLRVLHDPQFAPVFATGSRAEVPITAALGNKILSGQIDRLLITESEILIVDFKTNRPSPKTETDVPPQYIVQLKAYADTMRITHPGHKIRCALLWTDKPNLQHITSLDA